MSWKIGDKLIYTDPDGGNSEWFEEHCRLSGKGYIEVTGFGDSENIRFSYHLHDGRIIDPAGGPNDDSCWKLYEEPYTENDIVPQEGLFK